jgi:hypothetical protein
MAKRSGLPSTKMVEQHRLPPKQVHLVQVNGSYIAPEQRATKTLLEAEVCMTNQAPAQ